MLANRERSRLRSDARAQSGVCKSPHRVPGATARTPASEDRHVHGHRPHLQHVEHLPPVRTTRPQSKKPSTSSARHADIPRTPMSTWQETSAGAARTYSTQEKQGLAGGTLVGARCRRGSGTWTAGERRPSRLDPKPASTPAKGVETPKSTEVWQGQREVDLRI